MRYVFTLGLVSVACLSFGQKEKDVKAIKKMCGCFEVSFNFVETFSYPKDTMSYVPSKEKHERALEWVALIRDTPDALSLQHFLIVGEEDVVKHWRQDWEYEPVSLYDYNGFEDWKFRRFVRSETEGKWVQRVFEVDDKPRYQGVATWVHVDGRDFWQNKSNAPLPRREYTKRNDYNITKRYNDIGIVKDGWFHNQDNDKVVKDRMDHEYVLAQEKGYNFYKRVADSRCEAAQKWWKGHAVLWEKVRRKWDMTFAKNRDLKIHTRVDGKPLYARLFALKADADQLEVDAIIDSYLSGE